MSEDIRIVLQDNIPPADVEFACDDLIPAELIAFDVIPAELGEVLRGRDGDEVAGALLVVNRLSEFDTEQKKIEARTNLGLQNIDGGTFN